MARSTATTSKDIDVGNSGNAVTLTINARTEVRLNIDGETGNEFEFDVKKSGGSWIQNVGSSYTGSANYDDTRSEPAPEIRVRCSSGTGNGGDTATITLMAS